MLLCLLLVCWLGYELYICYYPDCGFKVAVPDNNEIYVEQLGFYLNGKSIFHDDHKDIWEKATTILDGSKIQYLDIIDNYTSPMHVTVNVSQNDGQTIVTYEGTGISKENGETSKIFSEKVFDYVVN